jgi:hypothetical protein
MQASPVWRTTRAGSSLPARLIQPPSVCTTSKTTPKYDNHIYLIVANRQGPFSTFEIDRSLGADVLWHHIEFSNDGKYILVSTLGPYLYLIDAFDGSTKRILRGHENDGDLPLKATFTPDAKFVLCGTI